MKQRKPMKWTLLALAACGATAHVKAQPKAQGEAPEGNPFTRNTSAQAYQLMGRMKAAYAKLQSFSATASVQRVLASDHIEGLHSSETKLQFKRPLRFRWETTLAAVPPKNETSPLFDGIRGPVTTLFDGANVVATAPNGTFKKGKVDKVSPYETPELIRSIAGFDRSQSLEELLLGTTPMSDGRYIEMVFFGLGRPQIVGGIICDTIQVQYIDKNPIGPMNFLMILSIGRDDYLLRQIITTGKFDGFPSLVIERIEDIKINPDLPDSLFTLPK